MFKNTSLTTILFFACLTAHAENWRYCAANAPLNSPCKAWVSAYLAGNTRVAALEAAAGQVRAQVVLDHGQGKIHSGTHACTRPDLPVDHEQPIIIDSDGGVTFLEFGHVQPMSGDPLALQQAGFGEHEAVGIIGDDDRQAELSTEPAR